MLFGSIGLSAEEADQYQSVFAQHEITLNDWDGLTYDLLKEMGIDKVGHRIRILRKMKDLYADEASKDGHQNEEAVVLNDRSYTKRKEEEEEEEGEQPQPQLKPKTKTKTTPTQESERKKRKKEKKETKPAPAPLAEAADNTHGSEENAGIRRKKKKQRKSPKSNERDDIMMSTEPDHQPVTNNNDDDDVRDEHDVIEMPEGMVGTGEEEEEEGHQRGEVTMRDAATTTTPEPTQGPSGEWYAIVTKSKAAGRTSPPRPTKDERGERATFADAGGAPADRPGLFSIDLNAPPPDDQPVAVEEEEEEVSGADGAPVDDHRPSGFFSLDLNTPPPDDDQPVAVEEAEKPPKKPAAPKPAALAKEELDGEALVWATAIKSLKVSTVGIHYRNSYTGECPYKFTTAGLLPCSYKRGKTLVVLLVETLWDGQRYGWGHFVGERSPDNPHERPERTAISAFMKETSLLFYKRSADALFATLTDALTLQMYYAKAQCVLFVPEIPYVHRSDAQVAQARSKALTTNQPKTRRMRWVPLRDVLKGLSDAQGRITINGIQEHLNPLTIALLSSPFARDHFAALQTRLEAHLAKQASSAAQRPSSSIPLHPSSVGSSQHPQLHLAYHPQRHQHQPHHHQHQPHRPHHQQHPRHHLPPHQHNAKNNNKSKKSFHKNKPLHKSWENPSTSNGSGRGDGEERRGPNRPSPDRLRKSADSTLGQRRPSPSSSSLSSSQDKSSHQPHGRSQGRPSGGGEGDGGGGAERSQPSA